MLDTPTPLRRSSLGLARQTGSRRLSATDRCFVEYCLNGQLWARTLCDDSSCSGASDDSISDCSLWSPREKRDFTLNNDSSGDEEEERCQNAERCAEHFDFDTDAVARALAEGLGEDELTGVIEGAMADALQKRLQAGSLSSSIAAKTTGDITGLMTPPTRCVSSTSETRDYEPGDAGAHACCSSSGELVAEALRKSLATRRRKSTRGECEVSSAGGVAHDVRRRSIALRLNDDDSSTVDQDVESDFVERAVRRASRRHRESIARAVQSARQELDAPCTSATIAHDELDDDIVDDSYAGRMHRAVKEAFFGLHHLYLMGE